MSSSQFIGLLLVTYIFCIHPLLFFVAANALIYWWRNRTNRPSGKTIWEVFTGGANPVTPKPKEL
jgi:hypothetical protein